MRADSFLTKMARSRTFARMTSSLPPIRARKLVIFTPLRSVHHQKCGRTRDGTGSSHARWHCHDGAGLADLRSAPWEYGGAEAIAKNEIQAKYLAV